METPARERVTSSLDLALGEVVPVGRVFTARCGRGLRQTGMFYVGNQADVGVEGLRVWPRGREQNQTAFQTGDTVAYFLERTGESGRIGIIKYNGRTFEYDEERSTAYRINTTITGHGKKKCNTDMGKAPCKADDGTRYWKVYATRDIKYGEGLRVPYRDRRHTEAIKSEVRQRQRGSPRGAGTKASVAAKAKRRQAKEALAERNKRNAKAKKRARQETKRLEREQRKQQRTAKWLGTTRMTRSRAIEEVGGSVNELNSRT